MQAIPDARLARDLRGAASRGEMLAHYQPQLDLSSGRVVGVEALARWHHPERGPVGPSAFIPLAEWAGVIREIGDFMLHESSRQAAEWAATGIHLDLSINVSPNQLSNDEFCVEVQRTLERYDLDPTTVTLEITEAEPILDLPQVAACLGLLRTIGVGVAIDDFGTGYSSLDQLRNLPATELKIDQSIIRGSQARARRLLNAVIEDAHAEGIRVVAEGVETQVQLDLAAELGCDRAQGYLIGRPMPADALVRTLS